MVFALGVLHHWPAAGIGFSATLISAALDSVLALGVTPLAGIGFSTIDPCNGLDGLLLLLVWYVGVVCRVEGLALGVGAYPLIHQLPLVTHIPHPLLRF